MPDIRRLTAYLGLGDISCGDAIEDGGGHGVASHSCQVEHLAPEMPFRGHFNDARSHRNLGLLRLAHYLSDVAAVQAVLTGTGVDIKETAEAGQVPSDVHRRLRMLDPLGPDAPVW